MKANEISLGDDQYRFHTTRWSVVIRSAQSQFPGFQTALGDLYRVYWYPLYAYVRRSVTPRKKRRISRKDFSCTYSNTRRSSAPIR